ncbi:hypothetical protein HK103_000619 [Boothiomyces macroporosus]|uniref:Uncharacterized protein n=1 Tax=Boothiomyces macroporosus TaxID=261099 RepID=A0AAD5YA61_9FUNG|nr:hypothetical protein HK103_000619 [Boothiomyces macroporosus]
MKVNFLLAAVAAQQSTFGGFTFNVSGNIYTSNGIWGNYDSYISSERVTLAACISDCKFNARFTHNDETCTLKDVRLDEFQFTSVGAFPYDVTGFVLDKNYGCSDINGQVSCQPDPDNSALTNSGSTSNFQGFTMSVSQGMYLSTNCNFKQSSIVMNATIAGNESEKTCQSGLRKYSGQYAYSYDTKNNFCYKYDLRLQNLTMVSNSSSNCGFYLPTSKMCYDDGTNVLCSLKISNATGPNNTTSSNDSSGSNTGLIVGVICGALIAVVLAGLGLVYYRKKSSPMSNKAFTPAQSFSSGINTPPNNVQHPALQYNYSAVPQNNVYQSYDRNSYVQGMSSSATTISPNYQRMSGNLSELSQHTPKIIAVESTYPQPFIQPQLYNPPYQPSPTVIQQPPILNQNFIPEQVHAVPSQLPILTPVGNGNRAPDLSYSIQPPLMNNPPSAATPIDGQCEDIPPPILDTHHQ